MEKLVMLSDLWGNKRAGWIAYYSKILREHFEIELYDSCELGEIDMTEYSEDQIHHQFINGGIEKAVKSLIKKEKGSINILGFSIGGYIAWKAACEGLRVMELTAVSSTRLRYENIQPECSIRLVYGEYDLFKPENRWLDRFKLETKIYKGEKHNLYIKKNIATDICYDIINPSSK